MSEPAADDRSIVIEQEFHHPPEKVWRALTEPHLIAEWLMKNDFVPAAGHRFGLEADWGAVSCEVKTIEPNRTLSYSWDTKDLRSTVTWTLEPTDAGTLVRMEQTGFRPEQKSYFRGATAGWPRFLARLGQVLARIE
jgi:uncharacterized protein YndB with AHSA1/START domain